MIRPHTAIVAAALVLTGIPMASAQDLSRYRDYALTSSVESVISSGGGRTADALTLHRRPAVIQETEWRAPYANRGQADSVRAIGFSFYNGALYQIAVKYDDDSTTGLTNADMIESLSATYGAPASRGSGHPASRGLALADTVVLARWENAESSVTLMRDSYSPLFQLLLVSKELRASAVAAIREASRLDAIEAPKRARELQKKDEADAKAALEKARTTNKAVFRP